MTALLMLMLLRNNGKGVHCKSYFGCFAVSLFILPSGIIIPRYLNFSSGVALPLLFVSDLLGFYLVPIVSESRPEPAAGQTRRSKRRTLAITLLYSLVICMDAKNPYLQIGCWIIYIHILQLFIAKVRKGSAKK